jgi:hypothetical protein
MATISFKVSEEEALQILGRAGSQPQITQTFANGFLPESHPSERAPSPLFRSERHA